MRQDNDPKHTAKTTDFVRARSGRFLVDQINLQCLFLNYFFCLPKRRLKGSRHLEVNPITLRFLKWGKVISGLIGHFSFQRCFYFSGMWQSCALDERGYKTLALSPVSLTTLKLVQIATGLLIPYHKRDPRQIFNSCLLKNSILVTAWIAVGDV